MEQNRNVDFDSGVEIDSLKDAVWRLTTRVYLLEDFIAEKFGEVISPYGFTKQASETPSPDTSDPMSSTKTDSVSFKPASRRKRRKQGDSAAVKSCDAEEERTKTQTNEENGENIGILGLEFQQIENDPLLINFPKDEVILSDLDGEDGDANDSFLNQRSDGENVTNDSLKEDPDFNPLPDIPVSHGDSIKVQEEGHGSPKKKRKLTTHMKVHTQKKSFRCSYCGKTFIQKGDMRRHERIHTGEKPFVCSTCGKGFNQAANLKMHSRIHTGEKIFKCTICNRRFTQAATLRRHSKNIHKLS